MLMHAELAKPFVPLSAPFTFMMACHMTSDNDIPLCWQIWACSNQYHRL